MERKEQLIYYKYGLNNLKINKMTQKEKAEELIDKMYYIGRYDDKEDYNPAMAWERSKQCALIAVDEILNLEPPELSYLEPFSKSWWQEVKQEIDKL